MTVELRPLGVKCNLQCPYCYQNPQREERAFTRTYDLDLMKAAAKAEGGPFVLFGGEPLLLPEQDLETLWSWGLEQFGRNAIQTNGTLINENHIRMFEAYKVSVGISFDGPDELNDLRWHGTLERTRAATAKTEKAVERLCQTGIYPGIIVTLHRANAAAERLPTLHKWFHDLERQGIRSARLHLLESENESVRTNYGLTNEENIEALLGLAALQKSLKLLSFDLFADMRRLLLGRDQNAACVWSACDPVTTPSVRGVEGDAKRTNCGRTNKDGIDFVKGAKPGFERYLALYATPQEAGGCKDCRFFLMCKGQCPGTAIDGDWRNRTEHCEVWKAVFGHLEAELAAEGESPLSLSPVRKGMERWFINQWSVGRSASMSRCPPQGPPVAGQHDDLRRLEHPGSNTGGLAAIGSASFGLRDRLPFALPDFTRYSWVSERARLTWEPRLDRIRRAWLDIEWLSAADKIRRCALVALSQTMSQDISQRWSAARLTGVRLPINLRHTHPGLAFFVVGSADDVVEAHEAWNARADDRLGQLFGYPECCRRFFQEVWVQQKCLDTTWAMATHTIAPQDQIAVVEGGGSTFANVLWRWLGVRAVPHLPCRFDCDETIAFAERLLSVGERAGFADEMRWVRELLSWPLEWSALHGIAEVKTPILKFLTRTDATSIKHVVRWIGSHYPPEGAKASRFPYWSRDMRRL